MPTKVSTPESSLRSDLRDAMTGAWLMTWHEDREIFPGVPDISYVMVRSDCETGWLELKAIRSVAGASSYRFTLEPSQHRWIEDHYRRVPVHLLCAVDDRCHLVHGRFHSRLAAALTPFELAAISSVQFNVADARRFLAPALIRATDRGRNEQGQ